MKRIIILISALAVLIIPVAASATARTASAGYYCTSPTNCAMNASSLQPGPTFNPQPVTITPYPVALSYDPVAGTLTLTQSQADASYAFQPGYCAAPNSDPSQCDQENGAQLAEQWASVAFDLTHGDNGHGPGSAVGR